LSSIPEIWKGKVSQAFKISISLANTSISPVGILGFLLDLSFTSPTTLITDSDFNFCTSSKTFSDKSSLLKTI